jgi:hypothetical protein
LSIYQSKITLDGEEIVTPYARFWQWGIAHCSKSSENEASQFANTNWKLEIFLK